MTMQNEPIEGEFIAAPISAPFVFTNKGGAKEMGATGKPLSQEGIAPPRNTALATEALVWCKSILKR